MISWNRKPKPKCKHRLLYRDSTFLVGYVYIKDGRYWVMDCTRCRKWFLVDREMWAKRFLGEA